VADGTPFGDIPLQADGSVKLRLPTGRLLLLQSVDAEGKLVAQRSRLFTMTPGRDVTSGMRQDKYYAQCSACHGVLRGEPVIGLAGIQASPAGGGEATLAAASPAWTSVRRPVWARCSPGAKHFGRSSTRNACPATAARTRRPN